jgi:NitT/TauT family transport system ATP-binding protein
MSVKTGKLGDRGSTWENRGMWLMTDEPLLRASGISKTFDVEERRGLLAFGSELRKKAGNQSWPRESRAPGKKVLENVEITVFRREIVALVGPSGMGKTTLLRIIAGKDRADRIDNNDVLIDMPQKAEVAWMPQETTLVPTLSALHNVALGARARGQTRHEAWNQAEELLGEMELGNILRLYPAQLSLGMRQRVALARTLAARPMLALLDEPLSSLDMRLRQDVSRTLRRYVENRGAGILLVTHTIEEAVDYADRICVLNGTPGRISMIALREGRRSMASLESSRVRLCRSRAEMFEVISAELGIRDVSEEP